MAKKVTRKHWNSEEDAHLVWCINKGMSSEHTAKILNGIHGNTRTKRAVDLELAKIQVGDRGKIEPVEPIIATRDTRALGELRDIRLYELKQEGYAMDQIIEILEEEIGHRYHPQTLHSRYSVMKLNPDKRPLALRDKDFGVSRTMKITKQGPNDDATEEEDRQYLSSLETRLHLFDQAELQPILARRNKLIYEVLSGQANQLRNYDSAEQFDPINVAEVRRMGIEERKRLAALLVSEEESSKIDNVSVITIPSYGISRDNVQVVFPLYKGEAENTVNTLRSTIHDFTMVELHNKENGFMKSQNFESRFRDLVAYNFVLVGKPDLERISSKITDNVRAAYDGVTVRLYGDIPNLEKIEMGE